MGCPKEKPALAGLLQRRLDRQAAFGMQGCFQLIHEPGSGLNPRALLFPGPVAAMACPLSAWLADGSDLVDGGVVEQVRMPPSVFCPSVVFR